MSKQMLFSLLVVTGFLLICRHASSADIRWVAVGLQGDILPDATIEVISQGQIIASAESSPSANPNVLSYPNSALAGDRSVVIRIRALGREEVSLVNMQGDANQLLAVVLPQVYKAVEPCSPQCSPCPSWCQPRLPCRHIWIHCGRSWSYCR